jgi:hypothetical protein
MNVNPARDSNETGVVTITAPEAPTPTTAVMVLSFTTVKLAAGEPPKLTAVAPVKLLPEMVTVFPDVSEVGANEEIVGGNPNATLSTKYSSAELPAWPKSGKKDIADLLMKYERSHWRDIRKEGGIHALLFPNSGHTAMYSADDIFEDVNGSEGEGESQGEGQTTNMETPVSDRNAVVVSKKEKTKQIHGCLDEEDLVIDDI